MPIIDAFPTRLREELENAYEEDLDEVGGGALLRLMREGVAGSDCVGGGMAAARALLRWQ